MAWILSIPLYLNNFYHGVPALKTNLKSSQNPLRLGILGAAAINPAAIIDPVQTHPDIDIVGIAARSKKRAQDQINSHGLSNCVAYGSYDELIADENIQAVYIPLPNGLHAEWAVKALEAGKHVLIEKPITANAEEARKVKEAAEKAGKVVLEAFHWRFHPAAHTVKDIVEGGEYGDVVGANVRMKLPAGVIGKDDIRFNYGLAGGSCMDLCYVFSAGTYLTAGLDGVDFEVTRATPRLCKRDGKVDEAMDAEFVVKRTGKKDVKVEVHADLAIPPILGLIPRLWDAGAEIVIEMERASLRFTGFPVPTYGHSITVTEKETGKKSTRSVYKDGPLWGKKGEVWWGTYRYQLEAFVDAIRAKETGEKWKGPWVGLNDSVRLMELIDAVYDKAGLPRRGER